uniref:Uncharacterized protein n=1 Tax=Magallana gigas TaxID=29159 RepID=K1RFI2_MAGGI
MSYGMICPPCGPPLQYPPHIMPKYGVSPAQPMAQQPTQDGASSQIQYGIQHQVNVAQLQDGSLPPTAVVNIEPDIEDAQYGGSTAQLQSSDTLLIAKAETESITCNVEGMLAVAESITETFPNSEKVQAIDGSMSNVQSSVQNYGSSALDTSNVTAQASRGFEPTNAKSSVHDFAIASHRTHARSEHNMSQLYLHDWERKEMSDGEEATTTAQSGATDNLHHYDDVLHHLSTMENHIGSLRTDMQTIVRRMKALEPDLFSPGLPDA